MEKEYRYSEISLEKARELILENSSYQKEEYVEVVEVSASLGRVLAEDLISPISQPPFPRSPLDGYAVRSADVSEADGEKPVVLEVIEEVMAGEFPRQELRKNSAVRIMTGAPIPKGADAIIRQEDTDYGEEKVSIYRSVSAYENYCYAGEDFKTGECLLEKGCCISAIEMGIIASMGFASVKVYRKPRVAIFTTGEELMVPGKELEPGKIYNSNLYVLAGRLREWGIESVLAEALPDDICLVTGKIKESIQKADCIITTGGVSVGKKDIMHDVFEKLNAERIFWKVQLKPGMPTIFAKVKDVPIIALSGNPYGALVNLELLVRPLLAQMEGKTLEKRKQAILQEDFTKGSKVRRFVRGICQDGKVFLSQGLHSSGVLASMRGCNCLIDLPSAEVGARQGDIVEVVML